ncbi:MAG TPA: YbfB/YjiJ family MFS transporter [Acetobacteraceae bacterium]|jgi:predicted MFS family arabinose efflux permease
MRSARALPAALGGLIALAAAIGIGRFVYTPILPPMIEALGMSKAAAGLIASANFLGYLLGALLAAWPNLPGSPRTWLLVSLAVSAVTTAGMGTAQTMAPFLLLRFIGGGASAVVLVLASAMVLEKLAEARRPGLSALHFAGVGTGIAASAILVAGLLRADQNWRSLWFASGAVSLLATVAVALLLRDARVPAQQAGGDGGPRPAIEAALPRLIAAYGLFGFGYVITATFIVAIVRATPAVRASEPMVWIVFGVAAAPSVALWTRIAERLGILASFAVACAIEAGGVLASVTWRSATGIFLATTLVGGTFMGLTALGLVGARALAAGDSRRVLAWMTAAFGLGQIIGPTFAGVVSDRLGSFTVPSIAAAGALLLAAGLVLSQPRPRPGSAATGEDRPMPPGGSPDS